MLHTNVVANVFFFGFSGALLQLAPGFLTNCEPLHRGKQANQPDEYAYKEGRVADQLLFEPNHCLSLLDTCCCSWETSGAQNNLRSKPSRTMMVRTPPPPPPLQRCVMCVCSQIRCLPVCSTYTSNAPVAC